MKFFSFARLFAFCAGCMDFATGLGLIFAPGQLLSVMRVPLPSADALVFLRFVGAFVAAVGATYLWALLRHSSIYLRAVFEFTIIFRIAAGVFSAVAIARSWLPPAWLSVPATDFALVLVQLWLLHQPRCSSDDITHT